MNNRKRLVFLTALLAAVVYLLARPYIFRNNTATATISVKRLIEEAFAIDKPLAIVFTYGAECCPSTEEFFAAYDRDVRILLEKYNDIEPVWLNVGVESKADQDDIMALARRYDVTQVPTLLILDKTHRKVGLLVGGLNKEEAESLLKQVAGS